MKKIVALLVSLTLIVGLFAACGEKKTEEPAPAEQTEQTEEERMEERRREAGADEKDRKDNIEKEKETKEKEEPKKAASSKGEAIDLGFTKNDVDAVIPIVMAMNDEEPELKIVMNEKDIDSIFEAVGKLTYDPSSDKGDSYMNENNVEMTMFLFVLKDGTSKVFAYGEDGLTQVVLFGLADEDIVYQAYGESPAWLVPQLSDDTEEALESGIDLVGAINTLEGL